MKNQLKKNWYFLSIYYANDGWYLLIKEITEIMKSIKDIFFNYIIYFSREKGENIRLAFSTSMIDHEIERYIYNSLVTFTKKNPSLGNEETRFGEFLWCNYNNNSLVWNNFKINFFTHKDLLFEEKTSQLILKLLNNDFSQDNLFSTALFLNVKVLKKYSNIEKLKLLEETIYYHSSSLKQFMDSNLLTNNLISQFKINLPEIFEIFDQYWDEESDSNSSLISNWIIYINSLLKENENDNESYYRICSCIFNILGIKTIEKVFLLQLLYRWQSTHLAKYVSTAQLYISSQNLFNDI